MVGGYDFFKSEFNRAVQARRQPGSAFKPFVYMAALESGLDPGQRGRRLAGRVPAGRNGKPWKPDNYDRKFRGPDHLPAGARGVGQRGRGQGAQEKIGIRRTVDVARRLGVESPLGENLSIALGTSDLTLLELTSAYGALANQGTWMRPTAIRYVLDSQRKLLEENTPAGQAGGLARARLRHDLHAARRRSSAAPGSAAKRARAGPPRPRPAPPTTTRTRGSSATRRGWPPGCGSATTGPRSLGKDETGSRVAVPIWTAFMQEALAGTPAEDFPIPERWCWCRWTWTRAAGACAP